MARRMLRRSVGLIFCVASVGLLIFGWVSSIHPVSTKQKGWRSILGVNRHQEEVKLSREDASPWQSLDRTGQDSLQQHKQDSEGKGKGGGGGGGPALSQEERVKQRFEERLTILHKACRLYYNTSIFRSKPAGYIPVPLYPPHMTKNIRYCPIAKTAATTWTHFLYNVKAHMDKKGIEGTTDYSQADDTIHFTFVREPYARMLSGYVDKLLTPNSLFWRITGKITIRLFRENATEKSLSCGHDLTFPEFVKYLVYSQMYGKHMNGHFIPTHDQCDMCTLPYRYIGHLETIKEDMPHIIKAIQAPINYTRVYDSETIEQNSKMVMWRDYATDVLKCMDMEEAGRRLWKKFQIRGLISKTEKFPFKNEAAKALTLRTFVRAALAAHKRSQANPNLKKQRVEALREAFASVPLEDKLYAQQVLFLDFQMFGFDPMLEDVFPKTPYVRDPTFSYFNIYD